MYTSLFMIVYLQYICFFGRKRSVAPQNSSTLNEKLDECLKITNISSFYVFENYRTRMCANRKPGEVDEPRFPRRCHLASLAVTYPRSTCNLIYARTICYD